MVFAVEKEAYDWLDKLDISYERFDHRAITAVHELDVTLPGQQVKNLLLKNKKKSQYYLLLMLGEKQSNLSDLAELLGEKRLSFASEKDLEELLHVPAGTVTPFGLQFDVENRIQVLVDASIDHSQKVGFHPFINSTTLNIAYADFERLMDAFHHSIQIVTC